MPVKFTILPARDLVVVRYCGFVTIADSLVAAEHYRADPGFRPDQRMLFVSTAVTGHETDYVKFLEMQVKMTETFARSGRDQLIGCLVGPSRASREMALMAQRSWGAVPHLVMMVHEEEAELLAFLGQPETRLADLLAAAAPGQPVAWTRPA